MRRKQQPSLASEKKASKEKQGRDGSPFAPDSAYSSGSNGSEKRPATAPSGVPKKPPSFTLFPSTPSVLSLALPPTIHGSLGGSELSLPTALPPMPKSAEQSPLGQRRDSVPGGTGGALGLKKRSSLIALKRFFRREKSNAELRDMSQIYELPA